MNTIQKGLKNHPLFSVQAAIGMCLLASFWAPPVFADPASVDDNATGKSVAESPEVEKHEGKRPLELLLNYKADFIAPAQGGLRPQPTVVGALTLGTQFDLERLLAHLQGASVTAQLLAIHGRSPSKFVGDAQTLSSIDGTQSLSLYQAYWNQSLLQDRLSFLMGVHDISSEFYQTESSQTFLNSTFAIGPELSRSGINGPSVYPITGLAALVRGKLTSSLRVRAAVYDGVPGDAKGEQRGTHLSLSKEEGYLAVAEANYDYELHHQKGMVGLGYWGYSVPQPNRLQSTDEDATPQKSMSNGAYILVNQKLYSEIEGLDLGLSTFLRAGFASDAANPITQSLSVGLSYLGIFGNRLEDTASIGLALARAGHAERAAREIDWQATPHLIESSFELNYRYKALSWLYVQPDFQWIVHPGFNPSTQNAVVGGARLEASL